MASVPDAADVRDSARLALVAANAGDDGGGGGGGGDAGL